MKATINGSYDIFFRKKVKKSAVFIIKKLKIISKKQGENNSFSPLAFKEFYLHYLKYVTTPWTIPLVTCS